MRDRSSVNLSLRKTLVPWLSNSDLDEGPRAVWDVEYRANQERASCWQIPLYEPEKSTCGYLVMKAVRGDGNDGGTITLSISATPQYDVYAKDSLAAVPAHSNPRRHPFRERWGID